jgi:hypothetical protein
MFMLQREDRDGGLQINWKKREMAEKHLCPATMTTKICHKKDNAKHQWEEVAPCKDRRYIFFLLLRP